MVQRRTEPGLMKIFRNYCGFALIYFFAFFIFTVIKIGGVFSPSFLLFYINLAIYALLYGYLSWVQLEKKMGNFYFPVAIFLATVIPIYSTTLFWPFEVSDQLTDVIYRSWYLFPLLVVPIALIAWQYGYKLTLVFVAFTAFYDLPFIIIGIKELNSQTIQLLGVPIQRAIAFGTVGVIVGLLMNTQRLQRRKLIQANIMLSQHASTLEELATSRERNRLARELHDTLAHTLSSQILTLEALRLSPPADSHEMDKALTQLIDNSRQGLLETRRALKDLRSKLLEDLGLRTSLELLLADAASRTDCITNININDPFPPISSELGQRLYRIAQEAIENIVHHAGATQIGFALTLKDGLLKLEVSDNGAGFDPGAVQDIEKHGIKGMRERVEEVGGKFNVSSCPQGGTMITAELEVPDDTYLSV
jgi:signal transduction histidine kinase